MAKSSASGAVLPGLIGGGVFLLFTIVFQAPFVLAAVVGAVAFFTGFFFFSNTTKDRDLDMIVEGVSREAWEQALKDGEASLKQLRDLSKLPTHPAIRIRAERIVVLVGKILDDIRKDPKDVKPARQFLSYYLDTTIKILHRYTDIASRGAASKDIKAVLDKVEGTLITIEKAFEKQLAKLLEDDVLDLDTELTVLERTIQMEGLGDDPLNPETKTESQPQVQKQE